MTDARLRFDDWIRGPFRDCNTELETIYRDKGDPLERLAAGDRTPVSPQAAELSREMLAQGHAHVVAVLKQEPLAGTFGDRLDLHGDVGMLIAAATRHGLNEKTSAGSSPLVEESHLALQLGLALAVAPRLILAPYSTRNRARNGIFKSFTAFPDEHRFIDYNTRGIFEYERAAEALLKVAAIGVSNSISFEFFAEARKAIDRVTDINDLLFEGLDVGTFFRCIRPYYLPSYIGEREYRGVNAGDFAGINQIDLLLGVCSADDPFYLALLTEKLPYVLPDEQEAIRGCLVRRSLLDDFLQACGSSRTEPWFQRNLAAFLDVCRAHGRAAAAHHNKLVERFIVRPARDLSMQRRKRITASGPPLDELLFMLERLRDLRLAKRRDDIPTRHADLTKLRAALDSSAAAG